MKMANDLRGARLSAIGCGVLLAACGCSKDKPTTPAVPDQSSNAKQIMRAIGSGPESLTARIERGLQSEQSNWDTLQPQTAEYARLARELGKQEPAKGAKESWAKLTTAFTSSADELDAAAKVKDLTSARSAQKSLGESCTACHREHRIQRGRPGPPA
jgi:cytochrome c556